MLRTTSLVVGVVLAACSPSQVVTDAQTPDATLAPTGADPVIESPSDAASDTILGNFDLPEYSDMFQTNFTTATVEGGKIRYVTEIGQTSVEFMVDPNDETKAIMQSSFRVTDITLEPTAAESDSIGTWFSITQGPQPEAVMWIRDHLDDYLAAPGAELSVRERFGDVCAGFFTQVPFEIDPDPLDPNYNVATLVGFFVEQLDLNGC